MKDFSLEVQFLESAVLVSLSHGSNPVFILDEEYAEYGDDKIAAAKAAVARAIEEGVRE